MHFCTNNGTRLSSVRARSSSVALTLLVLPGALLFDLRCVLSLPFCLSASFDRRRSSSLSFFSSFRFPTESASFSERSRSFRRQFMPSPSSPPNTWRNGHNLQSRTNQSQDRCFF